MTPALMFGFTLRTLVLWVVVRVAFAPFLLLPEAIPGPSRSAAGHPLNVEPITALLIASLVAVLLSFDMRALRERVFLANLGVSRATPVLYAFVLAVALEALVSTWLA